MALRDDLMVVVPESIRDETSWTSPKLVQVVRNLAMITRGRPYYTETVHNWLKSFETDPETLIEMPNGCKGGSILNGPVGESLSIGYLRLMRDDKYRDGWAEDTRHFLDTFEVETEKVVYECAAWQCSRRRLLNELISMVEARDVALAHERAVATELEAVVQLIRDASVYSDQNLGNIARAVIATHGDARARLAKKGDR